MQKLAAILLVDDDPTTNYLNQLLLEELAVADQVLTAENGAEALDILTHTLRPDVTPPVGPVLVLLDLNMPVMNGVEFLEAYQQLPPAQQQAVVVVMLTTSLHPRDLARLHELPIAGLVNKPLSEEKINAILQEHFQRELPAS